MNTYVAYAQQDRLLRTINALSTFCPHCRHSPGTSAPPPHHAHEALACTCDSLRTRALNSLWDKLVKYRVIHRKDLPRHAARRLAANLLQWFNSPGGECTHVREVLEMLRILCSNSEDDNAGDGEKSGRRYCRMLVHLGAVPFFRTLRLYLPQHFHSLIDNITDTLLTMPEDEAEMEAEEEEEETECANDTEDDSNAVVRMVSDYSWGKWNTEKMAIDSNRDHKVEKQCNVAAVAQRMIHSMGTEWTAGSDIDVPSHASPSQLSATTTATTLSSAPYQLLLADGQRFELLEIAVQLGLGIRHPTAQNHLHRSQRIASSDASISPHEKMHLVHIALERLYDLLSKVPIWGFFLHQDVIKSLLSLLHSPNIVPQDIEEKSLEMLWEISTRAVSNDSPQWKEFVAEHRNGLMRFVCITILSNIIPQLKRAARAPLVERIISSLLKVCSPLDYESVSVVLHIASQEVLRPHEKQKTMTGIFSDCIIRTLSILSGRIPNELHEDLIPLNVRKLLEEDAHQYGHAEPMQAMTVQLQHVRNASNALDYVKALNILKMLVLCGDSCAQCMEQLEWVPVMQSFFSRHALPTSPADVRVLENVVDFLVTVVRETSHAAEFTSLQFAALMDFAKHLIIHHVRLVGSVHEEEEETVPELRDITMVGLRRRALQFLNSLLMATAEKRDFHASLVVEHDIVRVILPYYRQKIHPYMQELTLQCLYQLTFDQTLWMVIIAEFEEYEHERDDEMTAEKSIIKSKTADNQVVIDLRKLMDLLVEQVDEGRLNLSWPSSNQLYSLAVICLCNLATITHSLNGSHNGYNSKGTWSHGISRKRIIRLVNAEHELLRCCGLHLLAKCMINEDDLRMFVEQCGEETVTMIIRTAIDTSQSYEIRERAFTVLCSAVDAIIRELHHVNKDEESDIIISMPEEAAHWLGEVTSHLQELWDCGCEWKIPAGFFHAFTTLMLGLLCQQQSYAFLDRILPTSTAKSAAVSPQSDANKSMASFGRFLNNFISLMKGNHQDTDIEIRGRTVQLIHALVWRLMEREQGIEVLHRLLRLEGNDGDGEDGSKPFFTHLLQATTINLEGDSMELYHMDLCKLLQTMLELLQTFSQDRHWQDLLKSQPQSIWERLCDKLFKLHSQVYDGNHYFEMEGPTLKEQCLLATNTLSSLMAISSDARERAVQVGLVDCCIEKVADLASLLHVEQFHRGSLTSLPSVNHGNTQDCNRSKIHRGYLLALMRLLRNCMIRCTSAQHRAIVTRNFLDQVKQLWSVSVMFRPESAIFDELQYEVLLLLLSSVSQCEEAKAALRSNTQLFQELMNMSLDSKVNLRLHAVGCRVLTCLTLSNEGRSYMIRANYVQQCLDFMMSTRKLSRKEKGNTKVPTLNINTKRLNALLRVIVGLSFHQDAQAVISRTKHMLDEILLLVRQEVGSNGMLRLQGGLIIRNLCFLRANKNHFMTRQDLIRQLLRTVLDRGENVQLRCYATSALWVLVHSNQRCRQHVRQELPHVQKLEQELALECKEIHGHSNVETIPEHDYVSQIINSGAMHEWVQEAKDALHMRKDQSSNSVDDFASFSSWTVSLWKHVVHVLRLMDGNCPSLKQGVQHVTI